MVLKTNTHTDSLLDYIGTQVMKASVFYMTHTDDTYSWDCYFSTQILNTDFDVVGIKKKRYLKTKSKSTSPTEKI